MVHTDTYTFKYNSDGESIDLNTLLLSQIHFSAILNEIKNEVAAGTNLSIKIKPLTKGSIPFDIILDVSWIEDLIHNSTYQFATSIVGALVGLIQLRIWAKGKKPNLIEMEGDKVILTIGETKLIIDKTIYDIAEKNSTIDKALQKSFEAIDKDESITGIEILDTQKTVLIDVPREEFENLTSSNEIFESITQTEPATIEHLTIFKVIFDKGYKWQFYLNGRKISASIKDNAFMDKLNNGERFAKGDILVVELEKERIFDKTLNIFIEKDFSIQNVIEHIPRQENGQQHLF
jgi:hypothetical protein